MPTQDVLDRLRSASGPVDALAALLVDHFLGRPVTELVDPADIAAALTEGLRASVADPRTEAWIRSKVQAGIDRSEGVKGTLRDHVPPAVVQPVKDLLRRPFHPDPELVRALLDHPAMRKALRGVLLDTLNEFVRRISGVLGDPSRLPGSRGIAQLMGMAKGMASAFTSEVERIMQGRVQDFVDDVVGRAAEMWVNHLTSQRMSGEMGAWRADLVDALLDQPLERYRGLVAKTDPERSVRDVLEILRALAEWEDLAADVEGAVRSALELSEERSLRDFLEGSGLEEGWRPHLEAALRIQLRDLFATDAFAAWLEGLLTDEAREAGETGETPRKPSRGRAPARKGAGGRSRGKTGRKGAGADPE